MKSDKVHNSLMAEKDISILIPFLNEEANIEMLAGELCSFTSLHPYIRFEILLINDGSTDGSRNHIMNTVFPAGTKLITLSQNFGSHAALRAGISKAKGTYITFLYADLQDGVENVISMYDVIRRGVDIVWAFREETSNSAIEKFFSRRYARLMQKFVNKKYPAQGFDIVMFNSKVAYELNKNIEANSSIFLQILSFGFKTHYLFYKKKSRKAGKSKWTISRKLKLLIDSFVAFSYAPIRLVSIIGVAFFVLGIVWTLYIFFRKFFFNDLVSGWPALMSVLTLGFGITNISLGIIAEYLWRTLDASRGRPVFIIDEEVEF